MMQDRTTTHAPNDGPECLQVKLLSEFATMPSRRTHLAAGYDLASAEKITVPSGGRAVVATDLSIACPEGTYARIAPRSGLAVQHMISCGAGVIDADYRGNVSAVLFNFGTKDFEVNTGDRIAQLILERASLAPAIEVKELTKTQRGKGGFGSTGIKAEPPSKKHSSYPNQHIFVRSPDKRLIAVTFYPSKTVSQVKNDIEQKLGLYRSDYLLYRDDRDEWCKRLDEENFSLSDYGIGKDSRLIVKIPLRLEEEALRKRKRDRS